MSNQKYIYDTVNQILDMIDQLEVVKPEISSVKAEVLEHKVKSQNLKLYEAHIDEKFYVVASSVEEVRKRIESECSFGRVAGVVTSSGAYEVTSADTISDAVSKDSFPLSTATNTSISSYTLGELVPHLFPSKEKAEAKQKLEEAAAKYKAAQEEYYRLYSQSKEVK